MNYRHAYHAGNFADVVKHILLIQLLTQMNHKGKPYYVLDAYGGRGLYSLKSNEATATNESKNGIGKLEQAVHTQQSNQPMPSAITTYFEQLAQARKFYDKHVYPGSPWWIANNAQNNNVQNQDILIRAEAFEKHADEFDALNYQLHQLPIGVHHRDAYEGIMGVIPPKERRGMVFIDPPFEQEHKDFSTLVTLLELAYHKWQQGTYVLWYPIKNIDAVQIFHKKMKRTGIKRQLICELNAYPVDVPVGLSGTGMLIINPPWQFDRHSKDITSYLAPILKANDAPAMTAEQSHQVKWLVGE